GLRPPCSRGSGSGRAARLPSRARWPPDVGAPRDRRGADRRAAARDEAVRSDEPAELLLNASDFGADIFDPDDPARSAKQAGGADEPSPPATKKKRARRTRAAKAAPEASDEEALETAAGGAAEPEPTVAAEPAAELPDARQPDEAPRADD